MFILVIRWINIMTREHATLIEKPTCKVHRNQGQGRRSAHTSHHVVVVVFVVVLFANRRSADLVTSLTTTASATSY